MNEDPLSTPRPTSGTFTVTVGGRTSPPLPFDATQSELQAAIDALKIATDAPGPPAAEGMAPTDPV